MNHDPERPFGMTIAFLPKFKIRLTGKEIEEGKLGILIKSELPTINDTQELHLLCVPYTAIHYQTVPDEIPPNI